MSTPLSSAGGRVGLRHVLASGDLTVEGRLTDASNVTLLGAVRASGVGEPLACVYKPIAGERPLWDFPSGTLAAREVATYELCLALGWPLVPPTVLRDGPFGAGMCQVWVEADVEQPTVDLVPRGRVPNGWAAPVHLLDEDGTALALAHSTGEDVRRTALLDVIANNADRKGSHLLTTAAGLRVVDHGLCFHEEPKLRTVLWGFAGAELTAAERAAVAGAYESLQAGGALRRTLAPLLAPSEIDAAAGRAAALLDEGAFPSMPRNERGGWRALPWPPL